MLILIHGAYHGGWCWQRVVDLLADDGIAAIAPDLPGHGTDDGWLAEQTLENYVDRIVQTASQASSPVTLVGHSLAGAIAIQAADRLPDKIAQIVFLTAYIPIDGETLGELVATDPDCHARVDRVDVVGINAICLKKGTLRDAFYNLAPDQAAAFAEDRVQLQSPTPFREVVTLKGGPSRMPRKSAILCTQDRAISVGHQKWMAERAECAPIVEIDCDHSPFLSAPMVLCDALKRIAN